ncbi:DUF3363 domain-containing protein [Stenotrophomonas sp. M37]|nr:DUF3363 domain-containing protein [Stenotrophomonas sp. M37]MRF21018.1 DUF3363 domain-containing protein [Stenotrophomonas sp. MY18]MRF49603.1 DUF3363 domain-containing protein [Stenotrophomonas sp. MY15]MRG13246.1 DUF3363 domain-containing protein [Stenotrophomonas sp. MY17]
MADPSKNLILVALSQLLPRRSKRNARKMPRLSIPELAASIARIGLLQNLIVIASADGEHYEVVAGDRRLAERRGQRVILARNLLGTLRNRELAQAAKDIAADTGLEHRPVADGQRVSGIYRRSVMLASGRYAMLDDGMGFSLVPWKPVIEQRLGQQLAATVRGGGVSWEIGRQRGPTVA